METIGFAGVPRSCSTTAQLPESSTTELVYLRYITGIGNYTALLRVPGGGLVAKATNVPVVEVREPIATSTSRAAEALG